ncbi:zf-HC2 domain-containing protein [Candidatus Bipolaricaulota bacterium]|nr:zf-HC2 domain-containing protein [Candidatus Bipolaricaulota bacterium]
MSICQTVHDWLPWYVSGHLMPTKMGRMAEHIAHCDDCQKELARVIQLRHQFSSAVDAAPSPADRVWKKIAPTLNAPARTRIDMGSFLIGLNFGIAANDRRAPVHGDLTVLGHRVRIIGKRRKGA